MEFSCSSGCHDCCSDPALLIMPTIYEIAEISSRQGVSVTEFFDTALQARVLSDRDEVAAHLRMPCVYISDRGCAIHEYKPLVCQRAPEDRVLVGEDWKYCSLGLMSQSRMQEVMELTSRQLRHDALTMRVLYSPPIRFDAQAVVNNLGFRQRCRPGMTERQLIVSSAQAAHEIYGSQVRERFERLERQLQTHG